MCDRRVAAFAIALLLPFPAGAQTLDTARLHHRADSLLALWREANTLGEVQQAVRALRHQRAAQVTRATAALRGEHPVQAGGLMVIADYPDSIPLAAAAARTWAILSRTYASHAGPLVVQPIRLTVVFPDRRVPAGPPGRRVPRNVSSDDLERTLLALAGEPAIDKRFVAWLGNPVEPVLDTAAERSNAYVQLVTAGSAAATRCFEGDVGACATALQLREDSDFYLSAYDPAQRRAVAAGARSRTVLDPAALALYSRCVEDAVDSACIDFLRGLGPSQVPRPLEFGARNLLVSTALSLGRDGAYDRLAADTTAPVIARLERAANAPIDQVVAAWRASIIAARPRPPRVPVRDTLLALGWTAVLATGALRSTRWRLT